MKKLTVILLAAISLLLPAAEKKAVGITDKGYSASAFFTA